MGEAAPEVYAVDGRYPGETRHRLLGATGSHEGQAGPLSLLGLMTKPARRNASARSRGAEEDRLIFLADALALVPFSETTLRRAISSGELEAWQPNRDGKLLMWRSTLIEWATRRPATGGKELQERVERRPSTRRQRRTRVAPRIPEPISLPDLF